MNSLLNDWADFLPSLLGGLKISLQVAACALVIGVPLGAVLGLMADSQSAAVRRLVLVLVEIGRGIPALVVLQLIYFGLPSSGLTLSSFSSSVAALALNAAAYTSEYMRAGFQAVPQGEREAADALGYSRIDAIRFVILPQGMRIATPAVLGYAIIIFQGTSLTFTIAMSDLLSQAYEIGAVTFKYLSVLSLTGLVYLAITMPAGWGVHLVEKRLSKHV